MLTGGALRLLDIPFVFSQVPLVDSSRFGREAKDWGYSLTLEDLDELNRMDLLVPLYMAVDDRSSETVPLPDAADHSRAAAYARDGRLRDPLLLPADERESLTRPDDAPESWWNGYFYSGWQLLELKDALAERGMRKAFPEGFAGEEPHAGRGRGRLLALAALADNFYPQIVGQLTMRDGVDRETLLRARSDFDTRRRLDVTEVAPDRLRGMAEFLLSRAHAHDPLTQWWDLTRHSDHSGWFRLRGAALEAIWQRIAAEVLLRAHEDLSRQGVLDPLPEPEPQPRFWSPLLDRIGSQPHADGLERALARLGLAPHPRVVLVLEGATEILHLQVLLEELGIGRANQVRLVEQGTSSDWPNQLARHVAPKLGRVLGGRRLVESGPTALVVAMDAEGSFWGSERARQRQTRRLRAIVDAEVRRQGGSLTDAELDVLVQTRVWGDQRYELANFSDDELVEALGAVAVRHGDIEVGDAAWQGRLRDSIAYARTKKIDIEVVFERMRWPVRKLDVARELAPVLLRKLEHEDADPHEHAPVLQLALDVYALVQRLSGGGYSLETPALEEAQLVEGPDPVD